MVSRLVLEDKQEAHDADAGGHYLHPSLLSANQQPVGVTRIRVLTFNRDSFLVVSVSDLRFLYVVIMYTERGLNKILFIRSVVFFYCCELLIMSFLFAGFI